MTENRRYCPNCGTEAGPQAVVCDKCTQPLAPIAFQAPPPRSAQPTYVTGAQALQGKTGNFWSRRSTGGKILLVVVGLFVLGGIGSALAGDSETTTTPTVATAEQNAVTAPSSQEVTFDPNKRLPYGQSEVWYLDPVTPAQAQNLLDYLVTTMPLDKSSNDGKSFHISRLGDTYEFRVMIKKGLETDQETIDQMKLISAEMSQNVFSGAEVDIHLCDENMNTLRVVVE